MSKQANPTVIGGFMLGALILVVIGILVFGGGALFRERVPMVTYFPGSVQGLYVGAGVQFEGVTVGRVTGIELSYSQADGTFSVPVFYEVWPDSVRVIGPGVDDTPVEILRRLVMERGLHARLESLSFVTGQYFIALQMVQGRPPRLRTDSDEVVEVPSLEATRDRMTEMLENLRLDDLVNEATLTLASIRQLVASGEVERLLVMSNKALEQTRQVVELFGRELHPLVTRMETTLVQYGDLATTLQTRIVPLAEEVEASARSLRSLAEGLEAEVAPLSAAAIGTLSETRSTMQRLGAISNDAGATRVRLDQALIEMTAAARAIRALADQLERRPESLLRGKR
jgi:paraquat-inducible protein B